MNAPSVPDVLNYSQTERRPRGMQISEGLFKGPMLQNRMYNKDRWEQTARWKKTQEVDYTPPTSSPASISYASFRLELFMVAPAGTGILNCALRRVASRRSTGPGSPQSPSDGLIGDTPDRCAITLVFNYIPEAWDPEIEIQSRSALRSAHRSPSSAIPAIPFALHVS